MNPMTNMKNVLKLSEQELRSGSKSSWHNMYKDSAWIFIGGLPYTLSEGDIVCVFSQYGEIVNVNLIRDKASGKSKGYCFLCYEDQRSTILAVDNLNGIKILDRTLRVDHVADYKPPKDSDKIDDESFRHYMEGCAPKLQIPIEYIKQESDVKERSKEKDLTKIKKKKHKHKTSTRENGRKNKKQKKSSKEKASSSENTESNSD